jgi:uncharacterized damage-inducible protein DinB
MTLSAPFIAELQQEAKTTRKVLERIPESAFGWKPHEKSMAMLRLATHVAEMTGWIKDTVEKPGIDFATMDYKPFEPKTTSELVDFFDRRVAESTESLKNTSDEAMMQNWTMRNGETVYIDLPRVQVLRGMVFNHIVHHRGQLSVYLRLNEIPVPELYGPSADEGSM